MKSPMEFTEDLANSMIDGSVFEYQTQGELNKARVKALDRAEYVVKTAINLEGFVSYYDVTFLEACLKSIEILRVDYA